MTHTLDDATIERLIEASFSAKTHAHCIYSNFPVGAAILCRDGTIFTGCNVECSVYPLGVCAERTAIVKACSEGNTDFIAIAISSDLQDSCIVPCGACRQFMVEFGVDWDVYMTRTDGSYYMKSVRELLPACFTSESLREEKIPNTPYSKCAVNVQRLNAPRLPQEVKST